MSEEQNIPSREISTKNIELKYEQSLTPDQRTTKQPEPKNQQPQTSNTELQTD